MKNSSGALSHGSDERRSLSALAPCALLLGVPIASIDSFRSPSESHALGEPSNPACGRGAGRDRSAGAPPLAGPPAANGVTGADSAARTVDHISRRETDDRFGESLARAVRPNPAVGERVRSLLWTRGDVEHGMLSLPGLDLSPGEDVCERGG